MATKSTAKSDGKKAYKRKVAGKLKQQSNAASTGGAGVVFENEVQASFVALMATGGYAPALPTWPIVRVALQTKPDGYNTDDCLVRVEQPGGGEYRHLLCQIKRQIAIRNSNPEFQETMASAWADFTNQKLFRPGLDAIALLTGPLTATDGYTLHWLTTQAREFQASEFFSRIKQGRMGPNNRLQKLNVIRGQLTAANDGVEVNDGQLHAFLHDFHILGFDFWIDKGVVVSLLHSHLSAESGDLPPMLWAEVVQLVGRKNTRGGSFELSRLPPELAKLRALRRVIVQPASLRMAFEVATVSAAQLHIMGLLALIGQWDQRNDNDITIVATLFNKTQAEVSVQVQAINRTSPSLLTFDDGVWRVSGRRELWKAGAASLTDDDMKRFAEVATDVLTEDDPALSLDPDERINASFRGLAVKRTQILRRGLAEGLAIAGSLEEDLTGCSVEAKRATQKVAWNLLNGASWQRWASLDRDLPFIAEVAPQRFLDCVGNALLADGEVFRELFAQERSGAFGRSYMTGVLWALESIGWETDTFPIVVLHLAQLAGMDPGGTWGNRPIHSLVTLLLPWLPQTMAGWEARAKALRAAARDEEGVAFRVASSLLPDRTTTSSMSHRPVYRVVVVTDEPVSGEEYGLEVAAAAALVLELAGKDDQRLLKLVDLLRSMPKKAFQAAIGLLESKAGAVDEESRTELWKALRDLARRHRSFGDASWALPEEAISLIEQLAVKFEPTDTDIFFRLLFSGPDASYVDEMEDSSEAINRLNQRRMGAISSLLADGGVERVVAFGNEVSLAYEVGYALMQALNGKEDKRVLDELLGSHAPKTQQMARAFIYSRTTEGGWSWLDTLDLSTYDADKLAVFYAYLPFGPEVWARAKSAGETVWNKYWKSVVPNPWKLEEGDAAIVELVRAGRGWDAVQLSNSLIHMNRPVSSEAMLDALMVPNVDVSANEMPDSYAICEVIKAVQADPLADTDRLSKVEWRYLQVLDGYSGATPVTLWNQLSSSAEFAISAIRMVYKSKNPDWKAPEAPDALIENAWSLLHRWRTIPGLKDGHFDAQAFATWLDALMEGAKVSGHLSVTQMVVGRLLAHAPADTDGFWIDRNIAEVVERREFQDLREAMLSEYFNSRGVHWVDPTGQSEFTLEARYKERADEALAEGFPRLAATMRSLAETYGEEGRRRASRHKPIDPSSTGSANERLLDEGGNSDDEAPFIGV